tara:strand:+ start:888 stop:1100 length:213 start_codon:yes stop_codon:yes gene_type:complete
MWKEDIFIKQLLLFNKDFRRISDTRMSVIENRDFQVALPLYHNVFSGVSISKQYNEMAYRNQYNKQIHSV